MTRCRHARTASYNGLAHCLGRDCLAVRTAPRGPWRDVARQSMSEQALARDIRAAHEAGPGSPTLPSDEARTHTVEVRVTPKRGRPPLPADEKRKRRLEVRLSEAECVELEAYAAREGADVAEAVREAALRAARWRP